MCREGAWFELTAEVTSVDRHSKPAARSFFIGKVQCGAAEHVVMLACKTAQTLRTTSDIEREHEVRKA